MVIEAVTTIIKSLTAVASAVVFLFSGLSLGLIPSVKTDEAFAILYIRGSAILCIIYYIAAVIYCMELNIHPDEMYAFGACIWIANLAIIGFIDGNFKIWSYFVIPMQLLLAIKTSIASYYVIDKLLLNDTLHFTALCADFSITLLLLLLFSVFPFTLFGSKQAKNVGLSIWSWEYCDCISHVIVCITYAKEIKNWDSTLIAYYVFFNFNIALWIIPSYFTVQSTKSSAIHLFIIDIITDVPMLIITLTQQTYVNNMYITVDLVVKSIVLLRGLIYIPIRACSDTFRASGTWHKGFDFKKSEIEYGYQEIE